MAAGVRGAHERSCRGRSLALCGCGRRGVRGREPCWQRPRLHLLLLLLGVLLLLRVQTRARLSLRLLLQLLLGALMQALLRLRVHLLRLWLPLRS